ncbi:hypothetical protein WBG78_11515 [Chryseolinea sp. T2]|uniref:hypothetical protein n=1 Tax=Chryseolinea sp. T2 TaxID=3129255 RepID=UPI003078A24C
MLSLSSKTSGILVLALTVASLIGVKDALGQHFILLTEGGGVTGNTTVFRISSGGEVAKGSGMAEPQFSEFAHLRKGKTKKYFRKTRVLVREHTLNNPGNMYKAITLVEGQKETKLVWGGTAQETPAEAQKLYQKIQASLNRLTFHKELRK